MSTTKIMTEIKRLIEQDPSLAISEWQGTCHYVVGEMISLETKDLHEIDLGGFAKPGEKQVMPIELLIAAATTSFGVTFHLEAHNQGVIVDRAEIVFSGVCDKAPFLGIQSGNSGITKPMIVLSAQSATNKGHLAEIAAIAIERSPILSSLKEDVTLHIK
ncbi:OsmC family protein [Sporosarcina ureae]|uniref:OsmC family protein n=1 Tax=Sporosarcina ureae TaxID=1571 RepID=UPI0026EC2E87|nr:OsmC family protein [Sporosarcina ureae]